ncbi:hypothetical protein Droror1_Dr00020121, partial [Drosera rotundifolia]
MCSAVAFRLLQDAENRVVLTNLLSRTLDQGYILGCPRTDMFINGNSKIKFCHRMGAILDDLYEAVLKNCDGNYFHQENTSNIECTESVHLIKP